MAEKKTNLCLSVDVTDPQEALTIIESEETKAETKQKKKKKKKIIKWFARNAKNPTPHSTPIPQICCCPSTSAERVEIEEDMQAVKNRKMKMETNLYNKKL